MWELVNHYSSVEWLNPSGSRKCSHFSCVINRKSVDKCVHLFSRPMRVKCVEFSSTGEDKDAVNTTNIISVNLDRHRQQHTGINEALSLPDFYKKNLNVLKACQTYLRINILRLYWFCFRLILSINKKNSKTARLAFKILTELEAFSVNRNLNTYKHMYAVILIIQWRHTLHPNMLTFKLCWRQKL